MQRTIQHFYDKIQFELPIPASIPALMSRFAVTEFPPHVEAIPLDMVNDNEYVECTVLIASYELVNNGRTTFLKGKFSLGGSKTIGFKVWNNDGFAEHFNEVLQTHRFFNIVGKINIFKGSRSIVIEQYEVRESNHEEIAKYLPCTSVSRVELMEEMLSYIELLDPTYRNICHAFLDDYSQLFTKAPAAMNHHHAYLGGLLKHTVGLMRVAYFIHNYVGGHLKALLYLQTVIANRALSTVWKDFNDDTTAVMKKERELTWSGSIDHMMSMCHKLAALLKSGQELDWNIVFTAILFHDSAKVFEYSYLGDDVDKFKLLYPYSHSVSDVKGSIAMDSNKGQGHIPMSAMILMTMINRTALPLSTLEIAKLNNTIFAHHGKLEWGSPTVADYPEGVIVHFADMCDSRYDVDVETK